MITMIVKKQTRPRLRPRQSSEPAFQLAAAFVHAFCGVFNICAAVYHLRRTRGEFRDAD